MSKSYRKHGGAKDGSHLRKKRAAREFRRNGYELEISNGNEYRRHYPQWDICDYSYIHTMAYERHALKCPEPSYWEERYPEGGYWKPVYKEIHVPPAKSYVNSDGHKRWRMPANFEIPRGWTFDPVSCSFDVQGDGWTTTYSALWGGWHRVRTGEYKWVDANEQFAKYIARDKKWAERETRNYRYSRRWPRYWRRNRKRVRNMKSGSLGTP